jgi:alpha-tubulin suppressor-like RCC1 family protein
MKKTLLLFFVLLTAQINAQCWQTTAGAMWHTVALKTDGTLWAWGGNSLNQLGDGTSTARNTPKRIGTANDWKNIAATGYHTIAIKTDGTLWAWGYNASGQLGDGSTTNRNTPTQIGTATDWKTIAAGENHTIAIKTDGSLWAWGQNNKGQLGDGTTTNRSIPTQIGTETDWKTIAGAGIHTVALKTTGTLWTWGDNDIGQLGDNTSTAKSIPTQIGTAIDWKTIGHGRYHTIAIKTDGTLWSWGYNGYGNLGDGTTTIVKKVPTQIGTATDWQTIAGGLGHHTIATKTDGTLWAWGRNSKGQLGDGTTTDRNTPAQIGTATDWQAVAAGSTHTIALKTDGALWTWGENTSAQLGDGTTTDRNAPTAISCPVAPTVTTTAQTNAGAVKATLGGDITADGGPTVTERGIVWATTTDPSTANNKVTNGAGLGSFSAIISALPPATLVYYRAYAINSAGTGYGTTISFTTADALSATTSQTNVSCTDGTNGSASVTALGGASPYTYLWSSSKGTSATATGLSAIAYTCTITDDEGTIVVKNFTITANDLTPPVAIGKNFIATLDASGSVTINATDLNNGSTDNCGIASYSMTIGTTGTVCGTTGEGGNLVITAPEGSKFTAVDFASYGTPTGTCGSFAVGSCNASNSVGIVSPYLIGQNSAVIPANNSVFGDPCGGTPKNLTVQASYSPTEVSLATKTYTCADLGDHTINLTVTDASGNSSTITAIVTVKDVILPTVITQTATVQLNASGQATVTAAQINNGSSDNCGIASVAVSPSAFTCANLGDNNTVTLSVTDTSGNVNTATAVVTVQDVTAPTVRTQNITVILDADGQAVVTPEMINNNSTDTCSGIVSMSLDRTTFSCSDIGVTSVSEPVAFTNVPNASQNTHSWGGGYNPNTTEFWYPQWSGSGSAETTIYKYDALHNATGSFNAPVGGIMQLWIDKSSTDYYTANWYSGQINRIDGNTNTVDWSYNLDPNTSAVTTSDLYVFAKGYETNTIVVLDKTTGAFVKNITLAGMFRTFGGLVYANGIIYISGYDINRISTVPATNSAIHSFNADTGAYISSVATSQACNNTAFDGETIWISANSSTISGYKISDGDAYENGIPGNKVKLTVTDAAGNTAARTARVIVTDITAPVITTNDDKNVNADSGVCGAIVEVSASAADNCSVGTATGVRSDGGLLTDLYPTGTTTIAWNVTDANGNAATEVTQTVIVSPVITSNGDKNVIADSGVCGAIVEVSATATDNCFVGTPTGIRSDGQLLSDIYPIGTTTITWNASDANGNAAVEVTQTVIVSDNESPTVLTHDITVQLDATGNASITASQINNGSSDACGITSVTVSPTNFDCTNVGPNTVTLTVTDVHGNVSTATAIVIVNSLSVNTITHNLDTLTADETGATTYQWMTYNGGVYANILNETNQSLSVKATGSYAVDITKNGCTQRSAVFDITTLGNEDFEFKSNLSVYPNPFNDVISISIDSNAKVEIYNLLGETIYAKKINSGTTQLNLGNHASGVYLIKATNENNQSKMVKAIKK